MQNYILDDDGQPEPCDDLVKWATWYEDERKRVVAVDHFPGGMVSTVFLSIDHAHTSREHLPVLWETMIFGGPLNGYTDRYCTRTDALAGHAEALRAAMAAVDR